MNNNTEKERAYWSKRYEEERTGWDLGSPSLPLKSYIDQLEDKNLKILIPGAGNAYEAEYLFREGFKNVYVMDISAIPLNAFRKRIPEFPAEQLIKENFFEHEGSYDLIFEQTFFCSFLPLPETRTKYGIKMNDLLNNGGKLVGLWFDLPLIKDTEKRPFGGTREEYLTYLSPYFETQVFERCHNSIEPRAGNELFGIFRKKEI